MGITAGRPPLRLVPKLAPTLTETITALTDYATSPEAVDLREAAQWITQTHIGTTHELPNGTFGNCTACGEPWPCPAWENVRTLTLEWLIRASTAAVHESQARS